MNLVKHFGMKWILWIVLFLTNFYIGSYVSEPFTYVDVIAIIGSICIVILVFTFYDKLKKTLTPLSLMKSGFLMVVAFLAAFIFTGILTGELLFYYI